LGELEGVLRPVITEHRTRRVASERQDVLDIRLRISVEDRYQLLATVADAREVRDGRQAGLALDPHDQVVCPFARRAAGPVGNRYERRPERLELGDRPEQVVRRPIGLGREEFEAKGGGAVLEDIPNMHGRRRNLLAGGTSASKKSELPGYNVSPRNGRLRSGRRRPRRRFSLRPWATRRRFARGAGDGDPDLGAQLGERAGG